MKHKVQIIMAEYKSPEFNFFSNGDMDLFFELLIPQWQHKSGNECAMFTDAKIRSFTNNDFIQVDGVSYQNTVWGMIEISNEMLEEILNKIQSHKHYRKDPFWAKLEIMEEYDKTSIEFCPN